MRCSRNVSGSGCISRTSAARCRHEPSHDVFAEPARPRRQDAVDREVAELVEEAWAESKRSPISVVQRRGRELSLSSKSRTATRAIASPYATAGRFAESSERAPERGVASSNATSTSGRLLRSPGPEFEHGRARGRTLSLAEALDTVVVRTP